MSNHCLSLLKIDLVRGKIDILCDKSLVFGLTKVDLINVICTYFKLHMILLFAVYSSPSIMIPKNTSLVIARIPVGGTKKVDTVTPQTKAKKW